MKQGRAKHKVSSRITRGNAPDKNRRIAELGEFAEWPEWEKAFVWRWRSMFVQWQKTQPKLVSLAKTSQRKLDADIGKAMRDALARGDWQFLDRLAKLTKFFTESLQWKADSIWAFSELLSRRKAIPVDPLRFAIMQEYFFTWGFVPDPRPQLSRRGTIRAARRFDLDKAKQSKRAFREYIEALMPDEFDAKTFDRACSALGIFQKVKPDNSRG